LLYGEGRSSLVAARDPDGRFRVRVTLPVEAS
jgi:hypothetical protein